MAITEGTAAPSFTLPDTDGNTHSLSDYAGKTVVIYFYPKDDTPGCTKEPAASVTCMRNFPPVTWWCWA